MQTALGIGKVLPGKPYAQRKITGRHSNNGLLAEIFFVNSPPFCREVYAIGHHVFYLNMSSVESIEIEWINDSGIEFSATAMPNNLVAVIPSGQKMILKVHDSNNLAVLCIHERVLDDKATVHSKGAFNKAEVLTSGPSESPFLSSVLREIEQTQLNELPADEGYLKSLCELSVVKILRQHTHMRKQQPRFVAHSPAHFLRVVEYIHNNLDLEIRVPELAAMVGLSPYHFSRVFREYLGQSPYQYALNLRFERAKELLTSTELGISVISENLGFSSQSHFQTFFKRNMGISPKNYRNKLNCPKNF